MRKIEISVQKILSESYYWKICSKGVAITKRVKTLYRNSTLKQCAKLVDEEHNKFDIPLQSRECQKFVSLHPDWILIDEKVETGISGYKVSAKDRDAITELKNEALRGEFDILLVFMFDRLGRIESETPFVVEWFVEQGIEVWSVIEGQQKFDTHVDKLTNYIRFWSSAGESAKTSTRVRKKREQMVEDGLYAGGYIPYGYHIIKKGTINHKNREVYDLEIDSQESEVVRFIFQLAYEKFYGARKISNELAKAGIRNRKGKLFGQSTINCILDNIVYTGVLKSGDTISKVHPHLQIIEPSIFEFVRKLRRERRSKDNEIKKKSSPMSCNEVSDVPTFGKGLVSGIIHCDCCGAKLRTKSTRLNGHKPLSQDNPRIPTYVCENRLYEGKKAKICISDEVQTQYRAYKIDDVIDNMVKQLLRRTKALKDGEFINYKYQAEWKRTQGNLNHAKSLYRKKQNEIISMENKIVNAAQSDEDMSLLLSILKRLKEEAEPLLEQVKACEKEVAEFQKSSSEIEREYNNVIKWADIYENADLPTKQIIVAHLIDSISVKKGYELTVNFKISLEQFENGLEFQTLSS